MTTKLSEEEKGRLAGILAEPMFHRAAKLALLEVSKRRPKGTIEEAALAMHYELGAREFLEELFAMSEKVTSPVIAPRKLKHTY